LDVHLARYCCDVILFQFERNFQRAVLTPINYILNLIQ